MKKKMFGKGLVLMLVFLVITVGMTPALSTQGSINDSNIEAISEDKKIDVEKGSCSVSQPPLVEWQKTFGGSQLDRGYSVQQTSDGGYFIVGDTASFGSSDEYEVYLIKTDDEGNVDWTKHNPGNYGKVLSDTRYVGWQTSNGGYVVTGTYQPSQLKTYIYFLKTYSNGNKECENYFTINILKKQDMGMAVQQTNDGEYIVTGGARYALRNDCFLLKVKSNCNKNWVKRPGSSIGKIFLGNCVRQTSDNGYIIVGLKMVGTDGDIWLCKTNSGGTKQWDNTFGGSEMDIGYCVQQTSDGGYILVGQCGGVDGDVCLIKTSSGGSKQWEKHFDGSGEVDIGFCVRQTDDDGDGEADDGYIIAGMTCDGSDVDAWIIKTDSSGNIDWNMSLGSSDPDDAQSVWQTSDGGYIIVGFSDDDVWLIKLTYVELPSVQTDEADPVGTATATLHGTILDDGGESCQVRFRYREVGSTIWIYPSDWSGEEYNTGDSFSEDISGLEPGTEYEFQAGAKNSAGEDWGNTEEFTTEKNDPPNAPTITGTTNGKSGTSYPYTFTSTDPDGDQVSYYVDWGDTTNTGWFGPYPSGATQTKSHTWSAQGTFTIKAKAKDTHGAESNWGKLVVTMPKNKATNTLFLKFLQSHSNMLPLLRHLL